MRYAQKKRGSALLMTLILSMALASTVLYAVSDTLNASVNSRREDNYARALAAAEYGAELAIAEIGNGVSADGTSAGAKVDGDFVVGSVTDPAKSTLYDNGVAAVDQRRITGTYGEQEFRVRVRSARQVYGNSDEAVAKTLIENGWLKAPENADKELTELKAYEFRDTYEITSTARNETISIGGHVPGELAGSPVVQAVVTFGYKNEFNKLLADTGLFHGENWSNFQLKDYIDDLTAYTPLTASALAYAALDPATDEDENITITGEDHYLVNHHNDTVTIGRRLQPMKLKSNESNYFGATGSYWEQGNITFNYKQPKDIKNNNNLIARDNEPINPYRPLTTSFGGNDTTERKKNKAMFVADKVTPYDMYLLGGKQHNNKGRTVTVIGRDDVYRDGVMGEIVETDGSKANPGTDFDIVLPRYEDLRNMYINVTAGDNGDKDQPSAWKQMFVGQYTNSKHKSEKTENGKTWNMVRPESVPLLTGNKIRPQSIHTVRDKDGQILVRLYAGPVKADGTRDYYKYPETPKYEIQDVYELYRVNGFNENHANVLNAYASDPAGGKNKKNLDAALKSGAFVERDGKYWMESDEEYTVTHPVTGETRQSRVWFEFRPCALGQSDYGKKYYGNFWAVDAGTGKAVEEPSNGFKNLQILVPVYVGQEPVLTGGNEWTGYYVWAHAAFNALTENNYPFDGSGKNGSGFFLDEEKEKMVYNRRNKNSRLAVGRIFPWQELVGYSLVKRTDSIGKGEPAIINQSDNGNDKRTMYADKDNKRALRPADRVHVGFDEVYQASADRLDTKYNGSGYNYQPDWNNDNKVNLYTERLGKHPLFDEKSPGDLKNYQGYLEDRDDPICVLILPEGVRVADGKINGYTGNLGAEAWNLESKTYNKDIKTYRKMDDFLFEKEFNIFTDEDVDAGTGDIGDEAEVESKILQTVNIMGGYEDLNEDGADNDYADLMFTVYIAYEEREDEAYVIARSASPWWERREVEGLTGDKSRLAVSFNNTMSSGDTVLTSDELRKGALDNLGTTAGKDTNLSRRVWTMVNGGGSGFADFPRAIFLVGEGGLFELDEENPLIAAYLKKWEEEDIPGNPVFYFTDADALDRLIQRVDSEEDLSEVDFTSLPALLMEEFTAKGYDMRPINERYAATEGNEKKAELLTRDLAEMVEEDPSSLGITRNPVYVREIVGAFTGSKDYTVPTVKTEGYVPLETGDSEVLPKSFLAGETAPIIASDGKLSFNAETTVPFRSDLLEIKGDSYPAGVRTVRLDDGRLFLSEDAGDTKTAVNRLYESPYPILLDNPGLGADRAAVWRKFGMKDRRGAIGYHRTGDLSDVQTLQRLNRIAEDDFPVFLDRYEPTVLGTSGQNHFRLTSDGAALVQELQNPDAEEEKDKIYASEFTYQGNEAATFVIDRPLDGAGVMVVNGNLVVEDTFAFHGILAVTGDLIIRPTLKKSQFVWSIDGWPMDAYDHSIIPSDWKPGIDTLDYDRDYGTDYDEQPRSWYYLRNASEGLDRDTSVQEDEKFYTQYDFEGVEPLLDDAGVMIPVLPQRVDEYRGALILQGKLLVKGRIITMKAQETVIDPETNAEVTQDVQTPDPSAIGKLNAYWSQKAVDAMAGMFPLGKPTVQRVSWTHNDDIKVDSIWQDRQELPDDVNGK